MPAYELSGEIRTEKLERGQEYRFEVDFNLKSGNAEIFGTEITVGPVYSFTGTKSAIYSWQGCELEIRGTPASAYTSDESPMMAYLNCNFALDRLRGSTDGPRVLIIGPEDSGKTTLVKILASYALKFNRHPLVVNLDPSEGMATLPGTLSAISISSMLDVSNGFGSSATTGATELSPRIPIAYCYGSDSPATNIKYYKHLLARLVLAVNGRLSLNPDELEAGLLIDTAGLIDQSTGYDLIHATVSEFEANVIICIGSERLAQDMIRKYDGKNKVTVIKLPKSGGCVQRDESFRSRGKRDQVRRYFYGDVRQALNPFSITVSFDDVKVYKVEETTGINTSLMPIGMEQTITKAFVSPFEPSSLLLNAVLALVHAESRDTLESLSESNVLGHVLVYVIHSIPDFKLTHSSTDVDDEKRRMTLLAPFQGRLPAKGLLFTSYREVL